MKQISVTRIIHASPTRIWSILTNPQALLRGETGITRLTGDIAPGQKISLTNSVAPNRALRITITRVTPVTQMIWESSMPLNLFWGRRVFDLTPQGTATQFTMTETYTGLLLPLIWRGMPDLAPSFETFANGLTTLAEETAT